MTCKLTLQRKGGRTRIGGFEIALVFERVGLTLELKRRRHVERGGGEEREPAEDSSTVSRSSLYTMKDQEKV